MCTKSVATNMLAVPGLGLSLCAQPKLRKIYSLGRADSEKCRIIALTSEDALFSGYMRMREKLGKIFDKKRTVIADIIVLD